MKKALGQTVRDIKREVNKKVLKVPSVEQKVLDATSNEAWGPHGLLLADIAQATKNYHDYQMIMGVIWKRINDTGKNWRHVYKALTVLEYLIAHGSERVVNEIKEHAYQISTLSDFQYIDSSGRDQGNNVRKKSQSIVVLVNDNERVQEVRQKAATTREKYRNTSMVNQPDSHTSPGRYADRYEDDRFGNRDSDPYGYGKETASYKDYEERNGRDGYKDDDYRERGRSTNDYDHVSRDGTADHEKDRAYVDDDQYSSRESGAKTDEHSKDGSTTSKRLEHKNSDQNLGAPPSYEEAVTSTRSSTYSERDGESSIAHAPGASSPPTSVSPSYATVAADPSLVTTSPPAQAPSSSMAPNNEKEVDDFDVFDPRGSFSAAPTASNGPALAATNMELDLLGSLSDSYSSSMLALVPSTQPTTISEATPLETVNSGPTHATSSTDQPFDDPFGDGPFKAVPSAYNPPVQQQLSTFDSTSTFNSNSSQSFDTQNPITQNAATEFGSSSNSNYMPFGPDMVPPANSHSVQYDIHTFNQDIDILADILPPSGPSSVDAQNGYPGSENQSIIQNGFQSQTPSLHSGLPFLAEQNAPQNSQAHHAGFPPQLGMSSSQTGYPLQAPESIPQIGSLSQSMVSTLPVQTGQPQPSQMPFHPQGVQPSYLSAFPYQMGSSQAGFQAPLVGQFGQPNTPNPNFHGTYQSQMVSMGSDTSSMVPSAVTAPPPLRPSNTMALVPTITASTGSSVGPQPVKDKFETKSSVWADTLSRGLVNLNISGSKTNPLADIGVDFDAINRKEKRMEKPATAPVTSTVTMGKAMGSGSGMGRAGASSLRPPPNSMMGSNMNMGMNGGPGGGMNMVGGYGTGQPMGRGIGMGFGQANQMQPPVGLSPGMPMPGGYYNPMMGMNNYPQRPYGGSQ